MDGSVDIIKMRNGLVVVAVDSGQLESIHHIDIKVILRFTYRRLVTA